MSSVDNRIVRMEFDNAGFEAGAAQTIETLDKLDEALNLDGAAAGLDEIANQINNVNVDGISNSIDECSNHFSAFGSFVTGIFEGLGNRVADFAIGMGRNLANALTQSARDGFDEYQLQINSIQTIAANSGASLDTITASLDQLNEYADKTIYNFSEMTANIGRFTAAGLGVEESTVAIQGFANAAALAGAGSAETSRGMYQLSQAMAAGVVKLQDWKSIQTASIDTKAFKDVIIETARAMDMTEMSVDEAIAANGDFTQSLKEGWLTADVMSQALQVMTMSTRDGVTEQERLAQLLEMGYSEEVAKNLINIANAADDSARQVRTFKQLMDTLGEAMGSGWATTWKLIFGDFEQATQLFTDLSVRFDDIISASADARNALLKDWGDAGGRDAFVGTIFNLIEVIERPLKALATAFTDVFGVSGKQLAVFTENIARFTESLVLSDKAVQGLYDFFFNLFTIIHSVVGVFGNFVRIIVSVGSVILTILEPAIKAVWTVFSGFVEILARIANALHAFSDIIEEVISGPLTTVGHFIEDFYKLIEKVFKAVRSLVKDTAIGKFISGIVDTLKNLFGFKIDQDGIFKQISEFELSFAKIERTFSEFVGKLKVKDIKNFIKAFVDNNPAIKLFGTLFEKVVGLFSTAKNTIGSFLKSVAPNLSEFISSIGNFGKNFYDQAQQYVAGSEVLSTAKGVLNRVGDIALTFKDRVVNAFTTVVEYFKTLTPQKLVDDISGALGRIGDAITSFNPNFGEGFNNLAGRFKDVLTNITDGANSFTDIFIKLKDWFTTNFQNFPDTIKNLFDNILNTFKYTKENLTNEANSLSFDNIATNLSNAGTNITIALDGFVGGILGIPDIVSGVFGDINNAINKFIDWFPFKSFDDIAGVGEKILQGGLIISLIQFARSLKNVNKTISTVGKGIIDWPKNFGDALAKFGRGFNKWREETKADQVVKIAGALLMLAGALFVIASIPADDLTRAGQAMGIMAAGLASFLVLIGLLDKLKVLNAATLTGLGAAMTGLGVGVLALSVACLILSQVPYDLLIKGETAVIGIMTVLSLYAAAMKTNGSSLLKGSIGMIALAYAIKVLVGAIEALGKIPADQISQGLDAFVRIMVMLTVFGTLAANGIANLLSAVLKFGAGVLLLSLSMLTLVGAIAAMSLVLNTITNLPEVLGVMGGALLAFTAICLLLKNADPVGVGLGLLAFSGGLLVMAAAFAVMSNVNIDNAIVGAILMGALVAEFAIIVKQLEGLDMVTSAVAIDMFAAAILVMAGSLAIFQLVDFEKIVAGATAIGVLIGIFGLMTKFLNAEDMIASALAIDMFSAAILIMAGAFLVLQQVEVANISEGLTAIGLALAAFVVLSYALTPIAALLPVISGAMLVFAVSVGVLAAAFWLISDAIVNLNEVGPERIVEVLGSFGEGLGKIIDELIARIPEFIEVMVQGILNGIAALAKAAWQLITSFVQAVFENLPKVVEIGGKIWKALSEGFLPAISGLADLAVKALTGFLKAGAGFLGDVLSFGKDIFKNITDGSRPVIDELKKQASDGMSGFIREISSHMHEILNSGKNIVDSAVSGLSGLYDSFVKAGSSAIDGLVDALFNGENDIWNAAWDIATSAWNAVASALGIASPSKVMRQMGDYAVEGFLLGFRYKMDSTYKTAELMAKQVPDAFKEVLGNYDLDAEDLVDMDYYPTITPVINRDEFDTGIGDLAANLSVNNPNSFNVSGFFKTDDPLGLSKLHDLEVRNAELVQEVQGLRAEMRTYTDAISQLSIIMDSGELVGAIAPQMDAELGQMQILSGRGVTR